MSRGRLAVVTGVIVLLVGAQLLDIATQTEHWPFSPYRMYSGKQGRTFARIQIYGVTTAGEFHLAPRQFLRPFDNTRVPVPFAFNEREPSDWRPAANRALRNVHELYELGRNSAAHDGPPLLALRLYRVEWRLDPTLATRDTPKRRQLLHELPVSR